MQKVHVFVIMYYVSGFCIRILHQDSVSILIHIKILFPDSVSCFRICIQYPDSVSRFRIRIPDLYSVCGFYVRIPYPNSRFGYQIFLSESVPATLYPYLESGLCIRIMYPDSAFGFSINPYSVTGFRIPYPYLVSKSVSKERLRDFTPILALRRTFVYIFFPVFMNLKDKNKCKN